MGMELDTIRERLRAAIQDFTAHQYAMQNHPAHRADGIAVDTVAPVSGEVLVIRMPYHTDAHILADITRFVQAQAADAGISLPVLVTPASEPVTTEPGG